LSRIHGRTQDGIWSNAMSNLRRTLLLRAAGVVLASGALAAGWTYESSIGSTPSTFSMSSLVTSADGTLGGYVAWPDGQPAANLPIIIFPDGYNASWNPPQDKVATDSAGQYHSHACIQFSCSDLQAALDAPPSPALPAGCFLMMSSPGGPADGFASTGGRVDWQMRNQACSGDFSTETPAGYSWQTARSAFGQ
jgi:hypothetical protein